MIPHPDDECYKVLIDRRLTDMERTVGVIMFQLIISGDDHPDHRLISWLSHCKDGGVSVEEVGELIKKLEKYGYDWVVDGNQEKARIAEKQVRAHQIVDSRLKRLQRSASCKVKSERNA